MRKPDIVYTNILPRDVELYVGMEDEECHKLESKYGLRRSPKWMINTLKH